ncbi:MULTISPECIES: tetratricopeptide repeat protein [unclassified Thioalkalivibrio]|uniref:tetratricopeptide repeat protein n=1 Tax=unclassified Thioalkalivibrio TaxID=2621013 RepID=UPI00039C97C3|nr:MULTISPECIES: tetratricopeptide repeat protein [unclassified Thioalkalivibrio]
MERYYDLGPYRRGISSPSPEARLWFNRGLLWGYGFNHEEAIRCFETAIEHDPECAMAWWGIAWALGPNYNKPWEAFADSELADSLSRGSTALARAQQAATSSPVEQALINALQVRCQTAEPPAVGALERWSDDYADAMRAVYREHGEDLDVVALFAEALLNRTPWQLWDLKANAPAEGASTVEATEVLETALYREEARRHPGILHYYVHLMEMSPHPERALRVCDRLRGLVPDAGHLQHMASHIDVLCGQYDNVVRINNEAIAADSKYLEREGAINFYTLYRSHNYHFKLYGAMFQGRYTDACEAAEGLRATIPEALLRIESPPMADWLESFVPMHLHVMVRFGRWQELIDTPLPADPELYAFSTALTHYAKGVANAATGRIEEGEEQRVRFEAAAACMPDTRYLFNNRCRDILAIARAMLNGELEYRKANYDEAFAFLRQAIKQDDGLPFDEPWGWMQPTRHACGALLLEQGEVAAAAQLYREDLGFDSALPRPYQHLDNVWALHGYHECLMRLGRNEEATIIKQRLDLATARADIPIRASCACRTRVVR